MSIVQSPLQYNLTRLVQEFQACVSAAAHAADFDAALEACRDALDTIEAEWYATVIDVAIVQLTPQDAAELGM